MYVIDAPHSAKVNRWLLKLNKQGRFQINKLTSSRIQVKRVTSTQELRS